MSFGTDAVRLARAAVESEVSGSPVGFRPSGDRFMDPSGAFVTLSNYPSHDLRGCIGFPMPVFQLERAIEEAARAACHDPRFPDLEEWELDQITVEVTVLTVPEPLEAPTPEALVDRIVIGRDGLIIDCHGRRGLLLPQVPVEWGWDARQFLAQLSMKAGLPPDAWMRPDARISAFRGEIFSEKTPYGEIREGE